jgi:Flp pilus assembly protein TadD
LVAKGDYQEAVRILTPVASAGNPVVLHALGKAHFMLTDYKKAAEAFEKAVVADPNNSVYHNWLGKALGRRAETANPFSAPILASKARQSFEKAVALDEKNAEAVNDLFSYYLEAPGFLGGGLDKAADLAKKIETIDRAEYHYALAQLAQKQKEFKSAEFHFRQAFQIAPRSVGRAIDLASFLSKQGRLQESEAIFAQAEKIAPNSPRLLFERANSYIRSKQNLGAAKALLERYLSSPLTPDDPPRAEAERLLKQAASLGA